MRLGNPRASAPFRRGVAQLTHEEYDLAVASFEEAIAIDPQFAEAHNQCAIAYFLLNDFEQSIDCCCRAIELIPQHFGAIAGMGHGYTQLGQLRRALECYRTAIAINPNMPAVARLIERLNDPSPNPPTRRLRAAVALRVPPPVPAIASSIAEGGERYTRRKVAVCARSA
jgi:tetratricopeptide (TPR) repeat protein